MARMTVAEATFRSMIAAGCEDFFNIPGRGIYPLLEELHKFPDLNYITGLHEFPVSAIADGYARAGRRPAFASWYMSTGVLNAASSIFLAQRDRVPMVVSATQAESWAVGADHRAEVSDIVAAVRPYVKWAWMPPTPDRVPEAFRRAAAIATTAPAGPTFVVVPVDYWTVEIDFDPTPTEFHVTVGAAADVTNYLDQIARADWPVVVAGYEALRTERGAELAAAVERIGAAIVAEPEPASLPASITCEAFAGSVAEAVDVIDRADLVLHLGTNTYEAFHAKIFEGGQPKRHLWVGSSAAEVNKVVITDEVTICPLDGWVDAFVDGLAVLDERPDRRARVAALVAAERQPLVERQRAAWDDVPMPVARVCAELRSLFPAETVLVDHSTTAVRLVREFFPVPTGAQYISASGSCQGWGLGAAVGAQLADRSRPVVGVVGDGGFMFGVQALATAAYERLPLLMVVLDNGGWSSMRSSLLRNSPSTHASGREMHFGWDVDIAALARSMGVASTRVETPEEIHAALAGRLPLTEPLVLVAAVRSEPKTSSSPFVGY